MGNYFFTFVCPSRTPIRGERARARGVVLGINDGQTNALVCPSRTPIRGERARACGVVEGIDDGQTNRINFIRSTRLNPPYTLPTWMNLAGTFVPRILPSKVTGGQKIESYVIRHWSVAWYALCRGATFSRLRRRHARTAHSIQHHHHHHHQPSAIVDCPRDHAEVWPTGHDHELKCEAPPAHAGASASCSGSGSGSGSGSAWLAFCGAIGLKLKPDTRHPHFTIDLEHRFHV